MTRTDMRISRSRRRANDDMPAGWTLAGTLDVPIPEEMDLAWGGGATNAELASKPLAFYFQGAAMEYLGNRAGCHLTSELEDALEGYYGIDRNTLYQGTSMSALAASPYTWHLTAYTDEFGDMWLALTPFRTANRRASLDLDDYYAVLEVGIHWNDGVDFGEEKMLELARSQGLDAIFGASTASRLRSCEIPSEASSQLYYGGSAGYAWLYFDLPQDMADNMASEGEGSAVIDGMPVTWQYNFMEDDEEEEEEEYDRGWGPDGRSYDSWMSDWGVR